MLKELRKFCNNNVTAGTVDGSEYLDTKRKQTRTDYKTETRQDQAEITIKYRDIRDLRLSP